MVVSSIHRLHTVNHSIRVARNSAHGTHRYSGLPMTYACSASGQALHVIQVRACMAAHLCASRVFHDHQYHCLFRHPQATPRYLCALTWTNANPARVSMAAHASNRLDPPALSWTWASTGSNVFACRAIQVPH